MFGAAVENQLGRISFFNPDTLEVFHQLPLRLSFFDVAVTPDCSRVIATSMPGSELAEINTQRIPPAVDAVRKAPFTSNLEDVDITPDGRFAVIAAPAIPGILHSYSLKKNKFVSSVPLPDTCTSAAVSPIGNGLILIARPMENKIRQLKIDYRGLLYDTDREINSGGENPQNITFTPNGSFAFIMNVTPPSGSIGILDTRDPKRLILLKSINTLGAPQSIVVSDSSTKVFVLTHKYVEIFSFNSNTAALTPVSHFAHRLTPVTMLTGIEQMALDRTETKIFISSGGTRELVAFSAGGDLIGRIPGIQAFGAVAICKQPFN